MWGLNRTILIEARIQLAPPLLLQALSTVTPPSRRLLFRIHPLRSPRTMKDEAREASLAIA